MGPHRSADHARHAAVCWRLHMSGATPLQNRPLEMPRLMIPGHHLFPEPRRQGAKIRIGEGANAQGRAELPAIALPGPALPLVVGNRCRRHSEMRGQILQGDSGNLLGDVGKRPSSWKNFKEAATPRRLLAFHCGRRASSYTESDQWVASSSSVQCRCIDSSSM
jgi:hypothetical protein